MTIEPIIFFELSAISIILVLGFAILGFSYAKLLKKLEASQKEKEALRTEVYQKGAGLLESAHNKAFQIINDADLKAKEILSQTTTFSQGSKEELDRQLTNASKNQTMSLEKASAELVNNYKTILEELEKENINQFKTVSNNIEKDTLNEVNAFKETLRQETVASQKEVTGKIQQEYNAVKTEIDAYKQTKIKQINDQFAKILLEFSKEVLGQTIDLDKHQDLVIKALERAKAELGKA